MSDMTFCVHGEWENEPDHEEFVHAELPCIVHRTSLGHLVGYVGVPLGHPAAPERMKDFNKFMREGIQKPDGDWEMIPRPDISPFMADISYQDIDVEVHGGLTFSGLGDNHIGRHEGFKWFGFDCAHTWDYCPPTDPTVHKIHVDVTGCIGPGDHETYRNWEYVKREVMNLAEQLAVMWQPPTYKEWKEKIESEG